MRPARCAQDRHHVPAPPALVVELNSSKLQTAQRARCQQVREDWKLGTLRDNR